MGYFDTETLTVKMAEMYVEGYKASLVKDTSPKGDLGGEFYAEGILEILIGGKMLCYNLGEKLL